MTFGPGRGLRAADPLDPFYGIEAHIETQVTVDLVPLQRSAVCGQRREAVLRGTLGTARSGTII